MSGKIQYVQEIADAKRYVRGAITAKDKETDKDVWATSDLHQVGYLVWSGIKPIASITRRWEHEGKVRNKIFQILFPFQ